MNLAPLLLALALGLPPFAFVRELRRLRRGERAPRAAMLAVFGLSLAPLALYAAAVLALVGLEEVTGRALVGEGMARTLLPLAAIGLGEALLVTGVFAVTVALGRGRKRP